MWPFRSRDEDDEVDESTTEITDADGRRVVHRHTGRANHVVQAGTINGGIRVNTTGGRRRRR